MARKLDARGIWGGNPAALDEFAQAFALDCGACADTFRRIYGWTSECLESAIERAFPGHDFVPMVEQSQSIHSV